MLIRPFSPPESIFSPRNAPDGDRPLPNLKTKLFPRHKTATPSCAQQSLLRRFVQRNGWTIIAAVARLRLLRPVRLLPRPLRPAQALRELLEPQPAPVLVLLPELLRS